MIIRRELILAAAKDLARDFARYDRKDDEDLPLGSIEEAIAKGELGVDDIVEAFAEELWSWLNLEEE